MGMSAKLMFVFGLVVAGAVFAHTMGTHTAASPFEIQGKLPVKLSEKFTLRFPSEPTAVAWSPDGSVLGVASDFGMRLNTYDSSGHPINTFERNGNKGSAEFSFAFVNAASRVLFPIDITARDDAALDIRDAATGHIVQTLTRTHTRILSNYFAVSPDQKRFAIANSYGDEVVTYATDNGTDWHELSIAKTAPKSGVISLYFFPDNRLVAVGEIYGRFAVVDSTTGGTLKQFHAYDTPDIENNVDGLAVSPKGDLILTGLGDWRRRDYPVVSIWRVSDGKEVASFHDKGALIRQAVWDPKGRFVAFIESDNLIVWQPEATSLTFIKIKTPGTLSLAVTQNGKLLAVTGTDNVTVYNINDN